MRAWSILTITKATDGDDSRTIEGIATTPSTDRDGDVVEPMGAEFNLPLPFLWQHRSGEPIGHVTAAKPTKDGINVKIEIAKTDEPGRLKDRLDEAWQSIKMGLVRGLSIGFAPIESARIENSFGIHFMKWDWLELSAVTIPANAEAGMTSVKSIKSADLELLRAASGTDKQRGVVRVGKSPGVTGSSKSVVVKSSLTGDTSMLKKSLQEQLAAFQAKRGVSVTRMDELMTKAGEEGRNLDAAEATEYDDLAAEIKRIDEHLARLKAHETIEVKDAVTVDGDDPEAATRARSGKDTAAIISVRNNLPKGTAFTRYATALAMSKGNILQAIAIAESRYKNSTPEVIRALKAAVDPGNTMDPAWAGALVDIRQMGSEFIELLRPQTILGRIPGLRQVPFNIKMPRQLTGSTTGWVGEGAPKPVSELSFDTVQLGFAKIAGIVVITEELARLSDPSAEALVRNDLLASVAQFQDQQFITPTVVAVPNVSPASITNGAPTIPSSGDSVSQVTADAKAAIAAFIAANIPLQSAVWVMNPRTALSLSMLRSTTEDTFAFPTINVQGGTFFGFPVVTSNSVPVAATSGDPTIIVLMSAGDVLLADEGAINIDVSREASLQMDSAPETGMTSLMSLWQNNLIGIRAERMVNWFKRRTQAVQVITGVTY